MTWIRIFYKKPPDLPDLDLGTEGPQPEALKARTEEEVDNEPQAPENERDPLWREKVKEWFDKQP